ncbi:MAG: RNA polymerase sigma factor [Acidimicrobiia bacterium]|nr:RNA polymerase sigma factor [Acidimicrobiia bacterium]MDX2465676.1 RNA polymerase sigma factor [Acidimicrobiia bacterium]
MFETADAPESWLTSESWPPPLAEVERACLGNPEAAESIYLAIQPRLQAFLRYQGFSESTRQDIAAEVSELVLTKIETLRKPVTFEAWFWTITRNRVHAWLRRKQRDSRNLELPPPDPTTPDEVYVTAEEHAAIRSALARLSDSDRHLLWLREVEGLSYRDISGRLNIAAGAVRVRSHRARQRLEAAFEKVAEHNN